MGKMDVACQTYEYGLTQIGGMDEKGKKVRCCSKVWTYIAIANALIAIGDYERKGGCETSDEDEIGPVQLTSD